MRLAAVLMMIASQLALAVMDCRQGEYRTGGCGLLFAISNVLIFWGKR